MKNSVAENSPVISKPAVKCEVGEPANAIDPKVAPPRVPLIKN